jgi:septal ring factor EnvC (AmiA/AmiB activator)
MPNLPAGHIEKGGVMLLINRIAKISSALVVLLAVAVGSAFADNTKRLSKQLADFKQTAAELRQDADVLDSHTRNTGLSWQTHTYQLSTMRDQVNELGRTLADLEAQKGIATEAQSMAIEHARPHLVALAENITQAFDLVSENRRNVYLPGYTELVADISDHADDLHIKLDTILDYESSRVRLDKLELTPLSQGS